MSSRQEQLMFYQLKTVLTQDHADPQTMGLSLVPATGSYWEIISVTVGPDNYGAGRTIRLFHRDRGSATMMTAFTQSIDNVPMNVPAMSTIAIGTAMDADYEGAMGREAWYVLSAEEVLVQGLTIAITETITVRVRAKIFGLKFPTKTLSGADTTQVIAYELIV